MGDAIVVGGAGFIGSHVADALSERGIGVRVFDVEPSPYLRDGQTMIVGDILDLPGLVDAADGCDWVYNFAGIADIDAAADAPVDTARLNVLGAVNVLEAAYRTGAKRCVFASTVYVFSESGSFYRASKQATERFVEAYHERFGLDYTVLRYGSLYGPRSDERNAVHRMIHSALTEGRIVFSGPRDAKREYVHVQDAARLSVDILADEYANRHLVVTGHEALPVQDVMTMLAEILPYHVDIEFDDGHGDTHYVLTPYAYSPRIGHKLTSPQFVDLGQGLMECIGELSSQTSDGSADGRAFGAAMWDAS